MINITENNLQQMQYWQRKDLEKLQADVAAFVESSRTDTAALIASHTEKANTIKGNGDLSQTGKQSRLAALVAVSDAALDAITTPLAAKLEAAIASAQRAIANALSTTPTDADIARMIEVREQAYAVGDVLQVDALLLKYADSGEDDLSCMALLSAPPMFRLVSDAAATRARAIMQTRLRPDQSAELESAMDALTSLQIMATQARNTFATPNERNAMGAMDDVAMRAMGGSLAPGIGRSQAPGA